MVHCIFQVSPEIKLQGKDGDPWRCMPILSIIAGKVFRMSVGISSSYNRSCCFPSSLLISTAKIIINLRVEEIKNQQEDKRDSNNVQNTLPRSRRRWAICNEERGRKRLVANWSNVQSRDNQFYRLSEHKICRRPVCKYCQKPLKQSTIYELNN